MMYRNVHEQIKSGSGIEKADSLSDPSNAYSKGVLVFWSGQQKQDGAHEPERKHVRKATYAQMTLL